MIKINLATRKQLSLPGGGGGGFGGLGDLRSKLQSFRFDPAILKERKIQELAAYIAVAIAATVVVDGLKQDQIKEVENAITKAQVDQRALDKEAAKYKTFESQKRQLDDDERMIQTKLEAAQRLIADRETPPKFLLALSSEIPTTAWLTDFAFSPDEMKLSGFAMSYSQISDFMKALQDNIYVTDVKLVSTGRAKADDSTGDDLTAFSLSAKRRPNQ